MHIHMLICKNNEFQCAACCYKQWSISRKKKESVCKYDNFLTSLVVHIYPKNSIRNDRFAQNRIAIAILKHLLIICVHLLSFHFSSCYTITTMRVCYDTVFLFFSSGFSEIFSSFATRNNEQLFSSANNHFAENFFEHIKKLLKYQKCPHLHLLASCMLFIVCSHFLLLYE